MKPKIFKVSKEKNVKLADTVSAAARRWSTATGHSQQSQEHGK